jgi:hypothetical protein
MKDTTEVADVSEGWNFPACVGPGQGEPCRIAIGGERKGSGINSGNRNGGMLNSR